MARSRRRPLFGTATRTLPVRDLLGDEGGAGAVAGLSFKFPVTSVLVDRSRSAGTPRVHAEAGTPTGLSYLPAEYRAVAGGII